MKAIKMLGLAVLTALTAVASVGATSAMAEATGMCTVDQSSCAKANLVTTVHTASVGKAKLLTSLGTVECNSLFTGRVQETGAPLVLTGEYVYTTCALGGTSCTLTEENGPSIIKILKEGHESGSVTGETLFHLVCGKVMDCTYNTAATKGTAKGPLLAAQEKGEIALVEQTLTKEAGLLCPKTAKLDVTSSPLTATYLASSTPLRMTCLDVGIENGRYLSYSTFLSGGAECLSEDKPEEGKRFGSYELGWVNTTVLPKEMACAWVGSTRGFYLTSNNGNECASKDGSTEGEYELGVALG
jgi:hypothetical protein